MEGQAQPAAPASALTAEQRERIERNRLDALERRRAAGAVAAGASGADLPAPGAAASDVSAARVQALSAAPPACERGAVRPLPPGVALGGAAGGAHAADQEAAPCCVGAQATGVSVSALQPQPNGAPAAVPRACARQVFDYVVVIDFESTCDDPVNVEPQEILEFPAVCLNTRTLELVGEWRTYVKPSEHPRLSVFCKTLTGITQEQVDAGMPLAAAIDAHKAWLQSLGLLHAPGEPPRFAVCTWTDWDCKVMLASEMRWRRIQTPEYLLSWIDLKKVFQGLWPRAQGGLAEACAAAGVPWEGRAHSGLDDARNTARLAARCIAKGAVLRITGGFGAHAPAAPRQATLMEAFGASTVMAARGSGGPPRCGCGVVAAIRAVKRPGPNNGRSFYSCGRYTITTGAVCDTFEWAPPGTVKPPDSWRGRRRRRGSHSE